MREDAERSSGGSRMRAIALVAVALLMLAGCALVGCDADGTTTEPPDAQTTEPAEPQELPDDDSMEQPTEEVWTAPDPVPQAVGMLASASGFDPSVLSGEIAVLVEREDRAWARVMVSHSDPGYETESIYLTIASGDDEWTIIDYGTGLGPSDLEAQGVPADVAAEIAAF